MLESYSDTPVQALSLSLCPSVMSACGSSVFVSSFGTIWGLLLTWQAQVLAARCSAKECGSKRLVWIGTILIL